MPKLRDFRYINILGHENHDELSRSFIGMVYGGILGIILKL